MLYHQTTMLRQLEPGMHHMGAMTHLGSLTHLGSVGSAVGAAAGKMDRDANFLSACHLLLSTWTLLEVCQKRKR